MIRCIKGTVKGLILLTPLLIFCWPSYLFCEMAQSAEDTPEQVTKNIERTTICEVLSNPGFSHGKIIELRAEVIAGLETNVLSDSNCSLTEQWPATIFLVESNDVPRTENKEYLNFWNLVQAYKQPKGKRNSIMPDKYTVTATVVGRFEADTPLGTGIDGQLILISVSDVVARPYDPVIWTLTSCDLVEAWKIFNRKKVRVRAIYKEQVAQEDWNNPNCPGFDVITIQWPDQLSSELKSEISKLKQYLAKDTYARAWLVVEGVFYGPESSKETGMDSSLPLSIKEQIRTSQKGNGKTNGFDYMIKAEKLISTSAVAAEVPKCSKCPPIVLRKNIFEEGN